MLKILIVDDEKAIRQNIAQMVLEYFRGAVLVDEASDGIEAQPFIAADAYDIVITDIKMTQKDGLAMIGELRRSGHNTVFIIISGFSEFEYAQKAIEYKVIKYLLKPISRNELEQALQLAVDTVKSKEEANRLAAEHGRNRELLLEQLLQKITASPRLDAGEILPTLSHYGIRWVEPCFFSFILDFFDRSISFGPGPEEVGQALKKQVDAILSQYFVCFHSFWHYDMRLTVLVNEKSPYQREELRQVLQNTIGHIERYNYISRVTAGVSSVQDGLESLHTVYQQASLALSYKVICPGEKQFYFDEVKERKSDLLVPMKQFSQLKEAVETNNKKKSSELVDEIFSPSVLAEYSIESIQTLYENLLNYMLLNLININPYLRTQTKINQLFAARFESYKSINEILLSIKKTAFILCDELTRGSGPNSDHQIIQKAISYIHKNYNRNISMSTVANYIGMSYNHFSKLFKDEIGENFIDYITGLRINMAKELLRNPGLDIKEITETVGYNSPRHFSKLFCQHTGLLPSAYRKKIGIAADMVDSEE